MPPRPALSSGRAGSSQRQRFVEERVLKVLERLAAAPKLEALDVQREDANFLAAALGPVLLLSPSSSVPAAPGTVPAVLAALVPALARGMQLAAQQLDLSRLRRQASALEWLGMMIAAASGVFHGLKNAEAGAGNDCGRMSVDCGRMSVALSVLTVRGGLPQAHEQLSLRLTSIISSPQAAQQQQMEPDVASLVARHLNLLVRMGWAWPGGCAALFSSSLCQAVPAAAGLAVASLNYRDAPVRTNAVMRMIEGFTTTTWHSPIELGSLLSCAHSSGRSVPAQIAGSGSVGTLLLMSLGMMAERLHQLRRGLSPAAVGTAPPAAAAGASAAQQQQRLAVPAHHSQLLQALGVAAGGVHPRNPLASEATSEATFWTRAAGMLLVTAELQQHLAAAAAAASCQQQLLMVLLECVLLDPTVQLVERLCIMLQRVLGGSDAPMGCELAPPLLRAILEQDAGRRTLEAAAAPAGADVSEEAGGSLSVLQVLAALAMEANTAWLTSAIITADNDQVFDNLLAGVAAVWLERPAQFASLLEARLRTLKPGSLLLRSAARAACAVAAAEHGRPSAGNNAMAADSQQQVFALLLSCIKAATAVAVEQGSSDESDAQDDSSVDGNDALAASVVQSVIGGWLVAHRSSNSSSSASDQPSIAAPAAAAADAAACLSTHLACVLRARCLVAAGKLMQQEAQAPASGTSHLLLEPRLLPCVMRAVTQLGQQLAQLAAAPAAEPWLQQLLDEHAQLKQQLESLQAQLAASREANLQLPAAAVAAVAEQLQAFGAAVCTALPVQQCCNHHDCRNLQQASELELVSGKSCVCGGCRVARYCSRECQVAHYKGWHKAVCRRLQAQRQQAQQEQQPVE